MAGHSLSGFLGLVLFGQSSAYVDPILNSILLRKSLTWPVLVLILPFTVINDLDLTKRARMGMYFVSLVGVLDIAISLIRFLNVELGDGGEFRSFTTIGKSRSG